MGKPIYELRPVKLRMYKQSMCNYKALKQDKQIWVKIDDQLLFWMRKRKKQLNRQQSKLSYWEETSLSHLTCWLEKAPQLIRSYFKSLPATPGSFTLNLLQTTVLPICLSLWHTQQPFVPTPQTRCDTFTTKAQPGRLQSLPEVWYHSSAADNVCGLQCHLGDTVAAQRRLCRGPRLV